MIKFVNAKINLGLNIVLRRPDGYHDLETVFYPVGLYNGCPENPEPFCDILEGGVAEGNEDEIIFRGRPVDCDPEKNLVTRALRRYREALVSEQAGELPPVRLILEKHLPDGAGLGGGSADATFTLRLLNEIAGEALPDSRLAEIALGLGADCPFFLVNRAAYGSGVGECLEPLDLNLGGMWCLIVKPDVYVSTKEAFSGVTPRPSEFDLRKLGELPVEEWRGVVRNDFETSIFPLYPGLKKIKEALYEQGALYASMSGSGSSIYGIFPDRETSLERMERMRGYGTCYLCRL